MFSFRPVSGVRARRSRVRGAVTRLGLALALSAVLALLLFAAVAARADELLKSRPDHRAVPGRTD